MRPKSHILLLSLVLGVTLGAASFWMLLEPANQLNINDPELRPAAFTPIEQPHDILIYCDKGKDSGWAFYGGDGIIGAFFVGGKPDEDFVYEVPSTVAERKVSRRRPEVAFLLTDSGELKDVVLTRSSGSPSLDAKALQSVRGRTYASTNHGSCRVVVTVVTDLRK